MIDAMYIADGHHRTAAAVKAQSSPRPTKKSLTSSGGSSVTPASSKYITALIFPDTQLTVLSFNRCIRSLNGLSEEEFFDAVSNVFEIEPFYPGSLVSSPRAIYSPQRKSRKSYVPSPDSSSEMMKDLEQEREDIIMNTIINEISQKELREHGIFPEREAEHNEIQMYMAGM
jgi:hypothetical protein